MTMLHCIQPTQDDNERREERKILLAHCEEPCSHWKTDLLLRLKDIDYKRWMLLFMCSKIKRKQKGLLTVIRKNARYLKLVIETSRVRKG